MAADKFPIDEAQIVALFMEAVTYGIYLVTLGLCIRALFWGSTGRKDRYNWPLIIVAGLMCVFATFDVAFGLRHNLDAFIFYKGSGGPDAEFEDISYWVNVMKVSGYISRFVSIKVTCPSIDSGCTNDGSHRRWDAGTSY
jgi:hypothetical protein